MDLGETEGIWVGMNGSEQIWMNLSESDWDCVSLYASDARHQARQAKPHPSHQSPIQLWLGLSVLILCHVLRAAVAKYQYISAFSEISISMVQNHMF